MKRLVLILLVAGLPAFAQSQRVVTGTLPNYPGSTLTVTDLTNPSHSTSVVLDSGGGFTVGMYLNETYSFAVTAGVSSSYPAFSTNPAPYGYPFTGPSVAATLANAASGGIALNTGQTSGSSGSSPAPAVTAASLGAASLSSTAPQAFQGPVTFVVPPSFPNGLSVGTPGPAVPYFNPPAASGSPGMLLSIGTVSTNSLDGRPVDNLVYINPPAAAATITPSTIAGASAGSLAVAQPPAQFIAFLAGYANSTTTNQVITFATPFTHPPLILSNTTGLQLLPPTTTTLTIVSPNSTTAYSGGIVLGGF